jgi:hypothetical protein
LVESNLPVKSADVGHELTDLSPKSVALFAIVLALTMVAAVVVTAALFYRFYKVEIANQTPPSPLSYTREPTPGPKLAVNPGQDLQTMRAAENSVLNSYDWIDKDKGTVRIPIARAVDILVERGLPTRPQDSGRRIEEKTAGQKEK